jgi:dihydropteroate synthase
MGVVNVTPDSFSGDGIVDPRLAIEHAMYLAENGADILDIGGESSRPGGTPVSPKEELSRVIPVIEGLRGRVGVPISVDTRRASVAAAATAAGASIVNDVWGFRADDQLASVVAQSGAWAVAMHNRHAVPERTERVGGYFPRVAYNDLVEEIIADLQASVDLLRRAGVPDGRIIVDPGIGFGKTPQQNLELLRRLREFRSLGFPLLIGTSRKSTIGLVLDLPPSERVEGTAATVTIAIQNGADVVRVHDLPAMARVARMADAIVRGWEPAAHA